MLFVLHCGFLHCQFVCMLSKEGYTILDMSKDAIEVAAHVFGPGAKFNQMGIS